MLHWSLASPEFNMTSNKPPSLHCHGVSAQRFVASTPRLLHGSRSSSVFSLPCDDHGPRIQRLAKDTHSVAVLRGGGQPQTQHPVVLQRHAYPSGGEVQDKV